MSQALTQGPHHIGLTVSNLEASAAFFVEMLGWSEVKRRPEYPAVFVSDGSIMLTLWAVKEGEGLAFNRKTTVGLHHLALKVADKASLRALYQRLVTANVPIEFAPEALGAGPVEHMMCYEPSGIRIEFIALT